MNRTKGIRIKSKVRFSIFLILILVVTTIGMTNLMGLFGLNIAKGDVKQSCVAVELVEGDTLWSIADRYKGSDSDTRKTVYQIQEINHLETADINPGETILVPIE